MKFLSGITALLFTTSIAFAAPSDLILTPRMFVTVSHDEIIAKITDSRASLLVASNGPIIRRDCFKTFRLNFPHAPQTTSYTLELNLPVKVAKNSITLEKVSEKANELAKVLRNRITSGCRTDISIMTLIEGETNNGPFRSEIQFFILKDGVKVQSGALQEKITLGVSKNVNLVPSVLLGDIWTETWTDFDPKASVIRRNY